MKIAIFNQKNLQFLEFAKPENIKITFRGLLCILVSFFSTNKDTYYKQGDSYCEVIICFGTKFKLSEDITAIERYSGLGIYLTLCHCHERLVE